MVGTTQLKELLNSYVDVEKLNQIIQSSSLPHSGSGELFLEFTEQESLNLENGKIKSADYSYKHGFGLRSFKAASTTFIHSSQVSCDEVKKAVKAMEGLVAERPKNCTIALPVNTNIKSYYASENPLQTSDLTFKQRVGLLQEVDAYVKVNEPSVTYPYLSLSSKFQLICIIKFGGSEIIYDARPLVRLDILVPIERNGRREKGYAGLGGRYGYKKLFEGWSNLAHKAIKQGNIKLEAQPAPAGEMTAVLGNGWSGVLLHEAVGHPLEADGNRKGISAFANLLGKEVAAEGVTVVDDGTIENVRGSLNVDDEGTPAARNVLIQNGKLVKYMQDCMNAELMGSAPTGNGRRESYAHLPLPRMTNTYMEGGNSSPQDIIQSVDYGVYVESLSGGQVDITSGNFVFSVSEAYLINKGKITTPLKGVTLIGNGPEILKKVSLVGNDFKLDSGIGTCSKEGQELPVGVGQPTVRIDSITVGGTQN